MVVGDGDLRKIVSSIESSMDIRLLLSSSYNAEVLQSNLQTISEEIESLEKLVTVSAAPFQPIISDLRLKLKDLQKRLSPVLVLVDLEGLKIPGNYDVNFLVPSLLDFIQEKGYLGYFVSVRLIVGDESDFERIQPSVLRHLRNLEEILSIHANVSLLLINLGRTEPQVADIDIGDRIRQWRSKAQHNALLVLGVADGDYIGDVPMIDPKFETLLIYQAGSTSSKLSDLFPDRKKEWRDVLWAGYEKRKRPPHVRREDGGPRGGSPRGGPPRGGPPRGAPPRGRGPRGAPPRGRGPRGAPPRRCLCLTD